MSNIIAKTAYWVLVLLVIVVQVRGRYFRLVSDGGTDHRHHPHNQNQSSSSSLLLFKGIDSAEEETCEQLYGFLPCSNSVYGHVFLMVVYEYLLFHGESYLAAGGEQIFQILGPGVFGASAFHVLGALPESLLLLGSYNMAYGWLKSNVVRLGRVIQMASGIFNSKDIAAEYVYTGVGLLAGTSILLLTILWGTCIIVSSQDFPNKLSSDSEASRDSISSPPLSWKRLPASLTGCGITTDVETSRLARIMICSGAPFLIMQIANIFQSSSKERIAILVALCVSVFFLLLYFIYQIFQPWVQKRRLEFVKHGHLVSSILQHVQKHALGRVLTVQGAPNLYAIRRLFEEVDEDGDNYISLSEVKELLLEIKFISTEDDKDKGTAEVMKKFDLDRDGKITKDEFINGFTKWIDEVKAVHEQHTQRSLENIYEVFQPWIENRRREREMKKNLMSEVLRHVQSNSLGSILTEDGMPDIPNIRRLFEKIDLDGNNNISQAELKELIADIKFGKIPGDVDESVVKLIEELDTSGDKMISEEEFVTGLTKWINKSHGTQPPSSSHESEDDIYQRTWEETDRLVDEEKSKGGSAVDKSIWAWLKAITYLVLGFVVLAVLAEPLIDSVQAFSTAVSIPSFCVAFVLVPLATNARQATSAIKAASRKTPRTTSLTFSEIYGGVFMNNVLGVSVLLAIIYAREMTWEFSAELLVVLIVCTVMGVTASTSTSSSTSQTLARLLLQLPKLQTFQLLKKRLTSALVMVEVWWSLLAAIPAVVAGQAIRVKKRRAEEERIKSARGREKSSDEIFVCERVCTSKRMLKKVGAFSKDPIPDTCVTVCGVSELDACADACARTVCVNQHQVPNWNDICLRRCQSECLKLSSSSSL
ncbi:unnamed protein product [Prunus armeniaca]|uniref:EF-hand domain-containing protein n=5 Tax=Prunus TaxID=3754 RepID=A0A6J5X4M5_PRUAR|nr:unnamed protein product [Prunus armeniaca]